ncbi:MAG: PD40 domain-containing protein [Blastocatellia bacterium]|nr:PD40 domain-containing protein [Blastocatellia bacterium]
MTNPTQQKVYVFEDFRLDAATRLLYRNGDQVQITPKAVETLIALVESEGKVIGKEELMQKIWADTIVEESNLAQYLHVLRKTLGETSDGRPYIETLKRRGYRFNGAVRVVKNGNGLATSTEVAEDFDPPPNEQSQAANPISRRVERHRNVRVFSNLAAARETVEPVSVERSDNIYEISDWRREPVADTSPAVVPPTRSKWFAPLVIVVLVAGFAGILFGIYKLGMRDQSAEARSVPFRGSDITRLTTSGRSKRAAISPDGLYVAHIIAGADGDSLWIRQVAVANEARIAAPSQRALVWVTFAPDGNFVYYLALERDKGETELFRVPVLGGPILKVANDIGPPAFSPDGTRLAFMKMNQKESRLIVAGTDGTNEVVLVSRHDPDYLNIFWQAPAWSLDGKSIAFPVNQSDEKGRYETVLAVDVETRVERKLTDTRWQQLGQPRWLADGLVVTASESSTAPNQLWHISLPDGTASRITRDLNNYQNLSLTKDAKTLAVIQNHTVSNIWTVGQDGAGAKQIMSEAGWLNELIWLPDGRLAYTSNAGGNSDIWTMNADGSNIRQLTVGANARLGLAVTADEKQLIFVAEREGKYNLWRIGIDGSNLTRITDGNGEFYPQCTPDGRWIIYQSGGNYPTLWKMPIGGGAATAITQTSASRPSVSPDGKFVAYHYLDSSIERSRWGIGISRLEDGQRIKRFDFPATVAERIVRWTRDGKSIAFLNSPGGISNIWTQPLDGGEPKPLTNFPSDSIITFNWNADGSQLAVIRGVETSDVLLINRSSSK